MRIVIVEDEFYAVERLKKIIDKLLPHSEIISSLDSVESAVKFFNTVDNYDLVFLDIQLSDGLSFSIFEHAEINSPIIFTTAFDEYAIQAFKVNSIDYLLKPIDEKELQNSLNKYDKLFKPAESDLSADFKAVIDAMKNRRKRYKERFLVSIGTVMRPVPVQNIAYFYSKNQLSYIMTAKGHSYMVDMTIADIESSVDPDKFFRINRQMIISFDCICRIEPYFSNRLVLKIQPEYTEDVIVSKRKVKAFKDWMRE